MKIRVLISTLLPISIASCIPQPTPVVPYGGVGTLIALIADSTGAGHVANAYIVEDPRVTTDVILQGAAGVWSDDKGFARLGGWRPGDYTLAIRAVGYFQERRRVSLQAGRTDTVRVVMRRLDMTSQ